jgi:PTH2 family peptidyl-tRNA hydrolase
MFEFKQVIVVRKDINMSPAKLGVQIAHACVGALEKSNHKNFDHWFGNGYEQKKVVLQVPTLEALNDLYVHACKENYQPFLVIDAGLTELPPDTPTCIGFPPYNSKFIDVLTGKLKLYK